MLYAYMLYSLSFFIMLFILFRAIRMTPSSVFEDAFYMLSAFALCKGTSAFLDLRASSLPIGGVWLTSIAINVSVMFSVIANIFLFQSAIDFLLYKLPTKLKFRVMPLLLFSGYLFLYMSNTIEAVEVERIGRFSFGYNSAILNSIAMFNLYYITKNGSAGLIFLGIGFILYALFEGIIFGPVLGIDIRVVRLICVLVLTASSLPLRSLLSVEKKAMPKIGYI